MWKRLLIVGVAGAIAFSTITAQAADLPGSLVGWWKLDDGTGATALDSTGNKHDGTLIQNPVWTTGEADTLILYVRGRAGNTRAPLYVTLEDAAKHAATVIHPDAAIVTMTQWTQWRIPLSGFTGVNLAKVKKLSLGVGDRANPKAGDTGLIYVDDISLAKP